MRQVVAIFGISLFATWVTWQTFYSNAAVDGFRSLGTAAPFKMADSLTLARGWRLWTPGSLALICSTAGDLHLALGARLPARDNMEAPANDSATLFVGDIDKELLFERAQLLSLGPPDIVVTEPISPEQLKDIVQWTRDGDFISFSFMTLETGNFMRGAPRGRDIAAWAIRCRGSR